MSFYFKRLTVEDKPDTLHSVMDPGIDADKSDPSAYVKSLARKHLQPRKGERLARFEVIPISRHRHDDVELEATAFSARTGYPLAAVIGIRMFRACVLQMSDVWLTDTECYGTLSGDDLDQVDPKVRIEIGGYCQRKYGEAQPDFFGLSRSQPSSEVAVSETTHSTVETAEETPSSDAP